MSGMMQGEEKAYRKKYLQIACQNNPEVQRTNLNGISRKNFSELKIQFQEIKQSMNNILNTHESLKVKSPKSPTLHKNYRFQSEYEHSKCLKCQQNQKQLLKLNNEKQELLKTVKLLLKEICSEQLGRVKLEVRGIQLGKQIEEKIYSVKEKLKVFGVTGEVYGVKIGGEFGEKNKRLTVSEKMEVSVTGFSQKLQPKKQAHSKKNKKHKSHTHEPRTDSNFFASQNEYLGSLVDKYYQLIQSENQRAIKQQIQLLNNKFRDSS